MARKNKRTTVQVQADKLLDAANETAPAGQLVHVMPSVVYVLTGHACWPVEAVLTPALAM